MAPAPRTPGPVPARPPSAGGGFLPGVQALRAAAVLLVVGYHLWPEQIPGGFAGVDVFFVISGFLITGHLARELADRGTVRLPAFYARRARRLLPAALTVLLVSAAGVFALLPVTAWERSFREILASALYYENWSLAGSATDYFAAEDAPTVVQHFWSLSVEEQFYLGWPVLFLLVTALSRIVPVGARRRLIQSGRPGRGLVRLRLLVVPAGVLLGSFLWSALHHGTGAEYFSTFTRAWEFAAGGLLAVAGTGKIRERTAVVLSGLGWIVVVGSGFWLTSAMRFPGWVAVFPVLGTLAVIAAGTPSVRFPLTRLIRSRPVQFTGGISYSLYLWHWPVIILIGRKAGGVTDSDVSRFALFGLSIALAVLSTYLIEAPIRRRTPKPVAGRFRPGGTGGTLVLAATGMAVVALVTVIGQHRVQISAALAQRQIAAVALDPPDCFGAAALDPQRPGCRTPALGPQSSPVSPSAPAASDSESASATPGSSLLIPDPIVAFDDRAATCMQEVDDAPVQVCATGPPASVATHQVAVIGDSHAMSWMPALQTVAAQQGWRLIAVLKESCPLTKATRVIEAASARSCERWNRNVQDWLDDHPEIDQVIVSASSKNQFVAAGGQSWSDTAVAGYLDAWDDLPSTVERIVVLRDVPRPRSEVVSCSQTARSAGQDVRRCGLPQAEAVLNDPEADAATRSDRHPVLLDLTRYFCADNYCSPGVGGAFVYRDSHHMTATFSRTLAPYLTGIVPPSPPVSGGSGTGQVSAGRPGRSDR